MYTLCGEFETTAIPVLMLTSTKGTTHAVIVEACGGWGIDIKQFAARKGLKLRRDADDMIYGTAKK